MVFPQRWHQSERLSILGEKLKIYPQVLTFFIKPKTWLFHVVVLLTTATKWTKVKNARAGRAKQLFLPTKFANSWRSRRRRRCRCLSSLLSGQGRQRNVPKCKTHVQGVQSCCPLNMQICDWLSWCLLRRRRCCRCLTCEFPIVAGFPKLCVRQSSPRHAEGLHGLNLKWSNPCSLSNWGW